MIASAPPAAPAAGCIPTEGRPRTGRCRSSDRRGRKEGHLRAGGMCVVDGGHPHAAGERSRIRM